jgi:hypothetical protein
VKKGEASETETSKKPPSETETEFDKFELLARKLANAPEEKARTTDPETRA